MSGTEDRPNVLLLLSDQHNHRALGRREGGEPVRTPTLDGLAEDGVAFEAAYAAAARSTPSRLSLLTGRRAPAARAWGDWSALPGDRATLAASLSAAGYETCLVGTLGAGGGRQFAGFDHRPYGDFTGTGGHQFDPVANPKARGSPFAAYADRTGGNYGHRYDPLDPDRRSPDPWQSLTPDAGRTHLPESRHQERTVAEEARAFLREHDGRGDDPWLLTASFSRPHHPLTAPERHVRNHPAEETPLPRVGREGDAADHPLTATKAERDRTSQLNDRPTVEIDDETNRRSRAAYFASVDYLDEVLGDFLAGLDRDGFLEDTVVVYASATGNLLGEHGLWWNGTYHEASARVPLVVQTPAHRRGDRAAATVETPVSLLDLFPTLCELTGAAGPAALDGTDLSAAVRTGEEPDRGPVVTDSLSAAYGEGTEFRAVRDGDEKHVRFRGVGDLRFDLGDDPLEVDALAPAGPPEAADVDFDALVDRRERDRETLAAEATGIDKGTTGNGFLLSDQRVVDADVEFYKPSVLAQDAAAVFEDWPEGDDGA